MVDRGCYHQSVPLQHHLHRVSLNADVGLECELTKLGHSHDDQKVAVQHVDVIPVRLQEVSLVNTLLLVVSSGELALTSGVAIRRTSRVSSGFVSCRLGSAVHHRDIVLREGHSTAPNGTCPVPV